MAQEESQEGVIHLLCSLDLREASILYPCSSQARPLLENFFQEHKICYQKVDLYDPLTRCVEPMIDLHAFKEIIFTSPSTVKAFIEIFSHLPFDKKLTPIGPITQETLRRYYDTV